MWGVVAAVALPVVLLLALLAVPVGVDVEAERRERTRAAVRLRWGFFSIPLRRKAGEEPPAAAEPQEPKERGRKRKGAKALAALRAKGFARAAGRTLRRVVRSLRVRELSVRGRFGLDDPADTGRAFGALAPLVVLMSAPRASEVLVVPDFEGPRLEGAFRLAARVVPLVVAGALVAFLLMPAFWRGVRAWRRA